MSKLEKVRKALKDNLNILILKDECTHSGCYLFRLEKTKGIFFTAEVHVAPKHGIYDAEDLRAFMKTLFDGKEQLAEDATVINNFAKRGDYMDFGLSRFCERIGTRTVRNEIILSFTEQDVLLPDNFTESKNTCEFSEPAYREIYVFLYPDAKMFQDLKSGNHSPRGLGASGIFDTEIAKYRNAAEQEVSREASA